MSLIIITKSKKINPQSLKNFIRLFLKIKKGPQVVTESLIKGLKILEYSYKLNPKLSEIKENDIVYVNESVDTLKEVVELKNRGLNFKLITGPAIVVEPSEENCIIENDNIDIYLAASQWPIDWWNSLTEKLKNKMLIWPAGVDDNGESDKTDKRVLIYYKSCPKELFNYILKYFKENDISYKILKYGYYNHKKYINLLKHFELAIFLSNSESQGIAIHEAWMADIKTLVYNRGFMNYKNFKWQDNHISAPYMTDNCGIFFKGIEDFIEKYDEIKNNNFNPRNYSLNNFTHEKIAKIFLNIINNEKNN